MTPEQLQALRQAIDAQSQTTAWLSAVIGGLNPAPEPLPTIALQQRDIAGWLTAIVTELEGAPPPEPAPAPEPPPSYMGIPGSGASYDPWMLSPDPFATVWFSIGGTEARHLIASVRGGLGVEGSSTAIELHAEDATAEFQQRNASLFLTGKGWDPNTQMHFVGTLELENKINLKTQLPEFWLEIPAGSPMLRFVQLGPNHGGIGSHDQPGAQLSWMVPNYNLEYRTVATCRSDINDPYIEFSCIPMFERVGPKDTHMLIRRKNGSYARIRLE